MAESWDYEETPLEVELVTGELMLETAQTCRILQQSLETVDFETLDPERKVLLQRRMSRISLFARLVPSILDPRRLVCLGDRAAENPDWWKVNKIHFFSPELTCREIGALTGVRHNSVRYYIQTVEIPADCYDDLPEIK